MPLTARKRCTSTGKLSSRAADRANSALMIFFLPSIRALRYSENWFQTDYPESVAVTLPYRRIRSALPPYSSNRTDLFKLPFMNWTRLRCRVIVGKTKIKTLGVNHESEF